MAHIPLPDNLLPRLRRTAQQEGLSLALLFEKMHEAYLSGNQQAEAVKTADNSESDKAQEPIDIEAEAFLNLYPTLVENHLNHYVAIYQGKLIDHDVNKLALFDRIEETYPENFVLMRPVREQPEREFHFRSPRYIERI